MQAKVSIIRCPHCDGILSHSLEKTYCISCGYIIPKEKEKQQTEAKK